MKPAQMTVAKVLRAPWNFEEDYATGVTGNVPIFFTHPFTTPALPAGTPDYNGAVDPEAVQATPPSGISPVLAKFVPCAMGSTMWLSFPIINGPSPAVLPSCFAYVWRVIFRLRTVADYNRRKKHRVPFSIPLSRVGAPDTRDNVVVGRPTLNLSTHPERVVRPASMESAIYNRTKPFAGEAPPYFSMLVGDAVAIPANAPSTTAPARYPGIQHAPAGPKLYCPALDYEQGERDPNSVNRQSTASASHVARFMKCQGNEFAVECFKYNINTLTGQTTSPRDWDFTFNGSGKVIGGEDYNFSLLLGVGARGLAPVNGYQPVPSIETGVRVIEGTSPL